MKKVQSATLAVIFLLRCAGAYAADFDGSKPLLCATVDAHECFSGLVCQRSQPSDLGTPKFLSINFAKKTIAGPKRATPILFMSKDQNQILMQGTEQGYAWTIALDTSDGTMTVTMVNREDTLVLFGNCTTKM
ncbi:hypothetical protein QU481_20195 [Crenobacter sp. SG2303]|uniref:Uncharacterized protein n=1 Tax=Crenobacter oryzisoli TaxID=3056844 RepID=A0ABT7XTP7_9NEIS|nr:MULTISPECIES: hypothetical protein [unclassified Crenobacter]MDN0077166.1 hypothetical protein [Crenobacter sp. SG2303]MDN0082617.1 hypothetical protein [Crenobacter sp. SG2305]